jgi:hypothetical protein
MKRLTSKQSNPGTYLSYYALQGGRAQQGVEGGGHKQWRMVICRSAPWIGVRVNDTCMSGVCGLPDGAFHFSLDLIIESLETPRGRLHPPRPPPNVPTMEPCHDVDTLFETSNATNSWDISFRQSLRIAGLEPTRPKKRNRNMWLCAAGRTHRLGKLRTTLPACGKVDGLAWLP